MREIGARRLRIFCVLLAVWGASVVGRLVQLQLAQGSRYRARAQRQQERRIELPGRRGSIVDRQGRELAVSVEVSSVYAVPDEIRNAREVAGALAPLLRVAQEKLLSRLEQGRGFVWLERKVDPAVSARIRGLALPGVHLVAESRRFYPKGSIAAAVLGYVGTDDRGLAGLEYSYDRTIRGKPGEIVALTDARRSAYGEGQTPGKAPQEGSTLVISLDSGIQYAAEKELAAAVEASSARSGSVVLMDPKSGEILAMASAPGFDPNQYGRFGAESRRNRAIADAYEPGSTFKIVTGASALEQGLVTLDEVIETGDGTIRVANTTISEHDHHRYGALTLAGIFEHSSNVGIIRVGLRLGPRRLFEGASAFGIGRATGVDLPGESQGIFRPLERWSALSNAEISMGQEVALTTLQLARVAAVVANGGFAVEPRLIRSVIGPDRRMTSVPIPSPRRVISESTARSVAGLLVGVVERGTGMKAAIPGFTVGGKTGTAQKAGVGGYIPGRYVPNFVGFAPAEDPRIVGVVVLEEPKGKYYAAEVAAPLFSKIVSQALDILRVAPEEQRLPATVLAAAGGRVSYPAGVVPASVRETPERLPAPASEPLPADGALIPDAAGLSARQALALFTRLRLPVRLEGAGFVVSQEPPAGSPVRPGETQTLRLSENAPPISRPGRGREETSSPLFGP